MPSARGEWKRKRRTVAPPPKPAKSPVKEKEVGTVSRTQARKRVFESLKMIGPAYNAQIAVDAGLSLDVVEHATLELANNRIITNLVSERDFTRSRGALWVVIVGDMQGTRPNEFQNLTEMPADDILVSLRRCLKGASGLWIEWDALKRAINIAESRLSSKMIRFQQHGDVVSREIPGHGRNLEYQWLVVPRPNEPDILKKRKGLPAAPLEGYVPPEELHAKLTKKDIQSALAVEPEDDVFTTIGLSRWLDVPGVTPRQIERWRRRGEGPAYFLVKGPRGADSVRYNVGDVREWLEGRL